MTPPRPRGLAALSTTPARAEALDEGMAAIASRLVDNIACATQNRALLVGDPAEDKVLTEAIRENALQEIERLLNRAHPSPTPAADADRVRPSLWWNAEDWEVTRCDLEDAYEDATAGEMRGVAKIGNAHEFDPIYAVRIDIDTTGDGEADDYEIKTFPTKEEADAYLAEALKSTATKEGEKSDAD